MSKLSHAWYERLMEESLPEDEAATLGTRLYREGWRQTSSKYRSIALGNEQRDLDLRTFKAFKLEERHAEANNEPCSSCDPHSYTPPTFRLIGRTQHRIRRRNSQ